MVQNHGKEPLFTLILSEILCSVTGPGWLDADQKSCRAILKNLCYTVKCLVIKKTMSLHTRNKN